jgi:hypothetical protein
MVEDSIEIKLRLQGQEVKRRWRPGCHWWAGLTSKVERGAYSSNHLRGGGLDSGPWTPVCSGCCRRHPTIHPTIHQSTHPCQLAITSYSYEYPYLLVLVDSLLRTRLDAYGVIHRARTSKQLQTDTTNSDASFSLIRLTQLSPTRSARGFLKDSPRNYCRCFDALESHEHEQPEISLRQGFKDLHHTRSSLRHFGARGSPDCNIRVAQI